MLFATSFNLEEITSEFNPSGHSLMVTFWPISFSTTESSLRSLSLSEISSQSSLSYFSLLVIFSKTIDHPDFDSPPVHLSSEFFSLFFEGSSLLQLNSASFVCILKGKESNPLTNGNAFVLTKFFSNKIFTQVKSTTIYPLFDYFPTLSQFSYRFGFTPRPHLPSCFLFKDKKTSHVETQRLPTLKWEKDYKLKKWRNDLTSINDKFYLTSLQVAKDGELLKKHGVTHIVNAASQVEKSASGFIALELSMNDGGDENILSHLFQFCDFVSDAKGKVVIHCIEGSSRSTSLLIGYFILTKGVSYEDGLGLIRPQRRISQPNPVFIGQLLQLYEVVVGTKKPTCFYSREKQLNFEIQIRSDHIVARPFANFISNHSGVFVSVTFKSNLFIGNTDQPTGTVTTIVQDSNNQDFIAFAKRFSLLLTKFLRCQFTN